ncbi:unnamed protein product [Peniophora sp. CBMAI 1063]|nr:unnamed protein product [Peniophora sp. CBMAI 1063]
MLLISLAVFILFCFSWSISVYQLRIWIAQGRPTEEGLPSDRAVLIAEWLGYAQGRFMLASLLLGDVISLWRAYVICGRPRWLYVLYIAITIIEGLLYCLFIVTAVGGYPGMQTGPLDGNASAKLADISFPAGAVALCWTSVAQLSSTILIAYKTCPRSHWKDVREFAHLTNTRHSIAILGVLIESGIIYLALILSFLLVNHINVPSEAAFSTPYYMVPLISMYPSLVVFLVATRRSAFEHSTGVEATCMKLDRVVSTTECGQGSSQATPTLPSP